MPGMLDKARSNRDEIVGDDSISKGYAKAIQFAYETVIGYGEEIADNDWLWEKEVKDFLARQETLCAKYEGDHYQYHDHQQEHLKAMRELGNDIRLWLDKKLQQNPTP